MTDSIKEARRMSDDWKARAETAESALRSLKASIQRVIDQVQPRGESEHRPEAMAVASAQYQIARQLEALLNGVTTP